MHILRVRFFPGRPLGRLEYVDHLILEQRYWSSHPSVSSSFPHLFRILRKETKNNSVKRQKRPFSRTVTAVHNAILEDLTYPVDIVKKRLRVRSDTSKLLKM